jgi:hypothetical protein
MKITKHTTIALTISEIKQSLFDYQSDIMHEMLIEHFNIPYSRDSGKLDSNASINKNKLMEWSKLLVKGAHSEEFNKLSNGRWIHTPSFNSGFVELVESFPHMFFNTDVYPSVSFVFDGLDAKDFSVKIMHDNGDETFVDSQKILDNI